MVKLIPRDATYHLRKREGEQLWHFLIRQKERKSMKVKKDESMPSEAQQWACQLESLGRYALALCEHSTSDLLHWPPPYLGLSSLYTLATQLIQEIECWVLVPIGERRLAQGQDSWYPPQSTFADLTTSYEEWIQEVHQILDNLPDAFLGLYVGSRFGTSTGRTEAKAPTVRMCLFKAMERCAVLLGHMEVTCQLAPGKKPSHAI
jgi:hypothetical protein